MDMTCQTKSCLGQTLEFWNCGRFYASGVWHRLWSLDQELFLLNKYKCKCIHTYKNTYIHTCIYIYIYSNRYNACIYLYKYIYAHICHQSQNGGCLAAMQLSKNGSPAGTGADRRGWRWRLVKINGTMNLHNQIVKYCTEPLIFTSLQNLMTILLMINNHN